MVQFIVTIIFFMCALAFFWFVLNWVGYKKGNTACSCNEGSCSSGISDNGKTMKVKEISINSNAHHIHDEDNCHSCNLKGTPSCTCD